MAQIHIVEANTTVEMPAPEAVSAKRVECKDCTRVEEGAPGLKRPSAAAQCAGEWTRAIAYIYAPQNQNMLVVPSATSLPDAVDKTRRCGGDPTRVTFYSNPVLACAPYIRCNL